MVKPTDASLNAILNSRQFFTADLYTITLVGSSTLRYCSGTQDITFNGNLYTAGGIPDSTAFGGPYWDRKDNKAKVLWRVGSGSDSLVVDCIPGAAQVNNMSFMNAIRCGFFDNADFLLQRAFMAGVTYSVSYSVSFGGVSDDFEVALSLGPPITVTAWFKTTATGGIIVCTTNTTTNPPSGATSWENLLYVGTGGKLQGGWFDGAVESVISGSAVNDGNWHFAAITVANSSVVQLFLDAVSQGTQAIGTAEVPSIAQKWIGVGKADSWPNLGTGAAFFNGDLDDVRFYNRVLSGTEITTLFNGGSVTSGLVAQYISPRAGSVSANDQSGNGNNGTVNGSPAIANTAPSIFNSGYGVIPSTNCAVIMFQGAVGMINVDRAIATFSIDDYRILFNQQMPKWLFAPTCQNALYDGNCTVPSSLNASSGTVSAGSSQSFIASTSAGIIVNAGQWFDNGKLVWETGPNAGLTFAVSSFSVPGGVGNIFFTSPLPFAPTTSDTFLAYPGCDRSTGVGGCGKNWVQSTITGSNITNFRGMPYIPDPQTAV